MDAWLEEQTFLEQDKVITQHEFRTQSRQLYFNSRRCTQSDVVSIVCTIDVETDSTWDSLLAKRDEQANDMDCLNTALYKSPLDSSITTVDSKIAPTSPTQTQKDLRWEEATFMTKLGVKREKRATMERGASKRIQRIVRGWLMRRWLKRNASKMRLQRKMKRSYNVISKQIRLKMDLAEHAKRTEERRESASIRIQSYSRRFLAFRAFCKERFVRRVETLNESSTLICSMYRAFASRKCFGGLKERFKSEKLLRAAIAMQSVFRMYIAKRTVSGMLASREWGAADTIAHFWRRSKAQLVLALEKERKLSNCKARAACGVQALVRGVTCRARFEKISSEHHSLMRDAMALSIQRVARGWILGRARIRYIRSTRRRIKQHMASIHISRVVRGFLGRRRAVRKSKERMTDIFYQARIGRKQQVEDLHAIKPCTELEDLNGNTVFTIACQNGHKKIVRKCLKWGLDINHRNDAGLSGVILATRSGYGELAEYLVTKKAELAKFGRTVLHDAAYMGLEGVVMACIHRDLDANRPDPSDLNRTPLHKAVSNKSNQEIVRLLIQTGGADIEAVDDEGKRPLHLAAENGFAEQVKYMIDVGADVSATDNAGFTPWRYAIIKDHDECAHLLRGGWQAIVTDDGDIVDETETKRFLEYPESLIGLCIERGDKVYKKIESVIEAGYTVGYQNNEGVTLLMAAASVNAPKVAELCFSSHMCQDNDGKTVFHHAVNHVTMLELLFEKLGPIEEHLVIRDHDGVSPIHSIIKTCGVPHFLFTALRESGLVLDEITDHVGNTALHYAAQASSETAISSLIDLGASPVAKNAKGDTPLHCMCRNPGIDDICKISSALLSAGLPEANGKGQLPVHVAASTGMVKLLTHFLDESTDSAFAKATDGSTPFHLAVKNNCVGTTNLLMQRCSDGCEQGMLVELLVIAASLNHVDCAKEVIKLVNIDESDLEAALTEAITQGHAAFVDLILQAQARALSGEDQVRIAAELGHSDVLKLLLTFIEQENAIAVVVSKRDLADAVVKSENCDSPEVLEQLIDAENNSLNLVHDAAGAGNVKCLKYLISLQPDAINEGLTEEKERTPLHMAARGGHADVVKWLLENGANHEAEDEDGVMPIELADDDIVEIFVAFEDSR